MWRAAPGAGDEAPQLYALLRQDLSQALLKRLSMFVLRAKAKLAATALHACGVRAANDAQLAALEAAAGPLPRQTWERAELPSAPGSPRPRRPANGAGGGSPRTRSWPAPPPWPAR